MTRTRSRLTIRSVAIGLLLVGLLGGGSVSQGGAGSPSDAPPAGPAAAGQGALEARELALTMERADRSLREVAADLTEAEAEKQRVSRGEEAPASPEPEPEPAPESAPESDQDSEPADPVGPVPASCDEYSGNQATGCALLLDVGFPVDQMPCLANLWSHESGWNERASNPSSGAYGIPQALPGNKMSAYGDDWRTNPATQIKWGLNYIENRYGTPCSAWSFFQSNNWY